MFDSDQSSQGLGLDVFLSVMKWVGRALALWLPSAASMSGVRVSAPPFVATKAQRPVADSARIEAAMTQGRELALAGHFQEASKSLTRAVEMSHRSGDLSHESKALLDLSGCRIRLFDYRVAQHSAEQARELALKIQDNATAGAAAVNLASIYLQLGDYSLAGKEAGYATNLLKDTTKKERLVKALLIYANAEAERARGTLEAARAESGDTQAERKSIEQVEMNYRHGVDVAHAAGLVHLEATLWEELGYSLLLAHWPQRAEEPLHKAYLLEASNYDGDSLANNQAHQAELQLQKKNYRTALDLIDQAFASQSPSFRTIPQFYPLHIRGVLLENLHREGEALVELRKAVDAATEWRQGALPGDATSTRTVVVLHDVYRDYAELAADLSLRTRNPELARQALEVLAENRAANLREQIALALTQKQRLPAHYFGLLTELQSAQAHVTLGENRPEDQVRLAQVRLEISSIENEFGLTPRGLAQISEKNSYQNSLRGIQERLSDDEVLLSFSLGKVRSFLWVVTRDQVNVEKLAGESEIGGLARQFSQAVQRGQETKASGQRLSQGLFGGLKANIWRRSEWLIVGDGVLLAGVPFASLIDLSSGSQVQYLTESHAIRFIPSELLLLSADKVKGQRRFVGVGDPIYNIADARLKRSGQVHKDVNPASLALPRLAGSDREVRIAARQSGMPKSVILVGQQASLAYLQKAIAKRPQILHFAVHVIPPHALRESAGDSAQAALALSLTKNDIPELLTAEAIATLRVPGSLVILSGCSSLKGEILPSAGLMGLSRAWLLAGASAVVVSAWPTPDDSGRFFSSFYWHFDAISSGTLAKRAALALKQAQVEMEHGKGYRSTPNFWAAYSIISKE